MTPSFGDSPDVYDESLSAYEIERLKLIARNRARLEALGIAVAKEKVAETSKALQRPPKRPRVAAAPAQAPGEVRRSRRLAEHQEAEASEADRKASELAVFMIDGECPRCGKVVTKGHAQHLARCSGPPRGVEEEGEEGEERPRGRQLSEEELAVARAAGNEKEVIKLSQLELSGLVDLTPEEATFIVIGSTGHHYTIRLRSDKRSCQCVDHRCRKHDCKHIRLILKDLGVEDNPKDWKQAVERKFMQAAHDAAPAGEGGEKQEDQKADTDKKGEEGSHKEKKEFVPRKGRQAPKSEEENLAAKFM